MESDSLEFLNRLTLNLLDLNKQASDYYHHTVQEEGSSADFHTIVKPFADKMLEAVERWEPLVLEWIREYQPKYVYPLQIHDTCENLTIISVTAFQKDTRRRRFINTISAIEHVLEGVLTQLPK